MALVPCTACGKQISEHATACPQCGHPRGIDLPVETAYYLQRTQVLHDIQDEIVAWAKRRAWVAVIVFGVVGVVGLSSLATVSVYNFLKDDLREATQASTRAKVAVDNATGAAKSMNSVIAGLRSQASDINDQFGKLRQQMEGESTHAIAVAQRDLKTVAKRLDALEGLVKRVARSTATSSPARSAVAEYGREVRAVETAAKNTVSAFDRNADFFVHISPSRQTNATSKKAFDTFAKSGFKTSTFTSVEKPKQTTVVYGPGEDTVAAAKEIESILVREFGFSNIAVISRRLGRSSFTSGHVGIFIGTADGG